MSDLSVPVISKNGLRGRVLTNSKLLDDRPQKSVIFESGREVSIGSEHFHLQKDGTYFLDLSVNPAPEESVARNVPPVAKGERPVFAEPVPTVVEGNADAAAMVIPRVEEQIVVTRRVVETGRVRITKSVTEHPVTVDEPTIHQEYQIERVPINRVVTDVEGSRIEGDTTIIPVYEEEVVTTKRLILREEIRLTKSRREESNPQTIILRKENIEVERMPSGPIQKSNRVTES